MDDTKRNALISFMCGKLVFENLNQAIGQSDGGDSVFHTSLTVARDELIVVKTALAAAGLPFSYNVETKLTSVLEKTSGGEEERFTHRIRDVLDNLEGMKNELISQILESHLKVIHIIDLRE